MMLDEGTILVTGGAGFIGSALVWALNQRGYERILIADALDRTDKWRNLVPLRFLDYIEAFDLQRRIEHEPDALDDVRVVFHLGACSSTTETDASYLIRNNFEYTKMIAEWALGRNVRFVYASSAATYGSLERNLSESRELTSLRPLNMYGYSKHLFDLYAARHGFLDRIIGLKYFNVYGPNEGHKGDMRSMVNKAFHQIAETGSVKLFKSARPDFRDGEQQRDFLYVKDAVAMTLHLAEQEVLSGLFNVGSGAPHTWIELSNAVFDAMGKPPVIEFIDMPAALRGKYQYATSADISRLRQTGYTRAVTPLAHAIKDYVQQYLMPKRLLGDELVTVAAD